MLSADRMENVCVMQRVTRGVCSDTHLSAHTNALGTHTDTHTLIKRCIMKLHDACISSGWLWLI